MDIIAERRLTLQVEDELIEVTAALTQPKRVGDNEWTCTCVTTFGSEEHSSAIHGGDSMQALQLAMGTLDVELKYWAKGRGGTLLYFDEPFQSTLQDSGMQRK